MGTSILVLENLNREWSYKEEYWEKLRSNGLQARRKNKLRFSRESMGAAKDMVILGQDVPDPHI